MLKYKYGALAGLLIVIGYAALLPCMDNLSDAMIWSVIALIIIVSSLFLSYSAGDLIYKNMLATAIVVFIGWLALSIGIGNYFMPIFGNVGGTLPRDAANTH